jgi:hypothetical protein
MLELFKQNAEGIFGLLMSGAAIVIPLIVRAILAAIKNKQIQDALPGIVKGIHAAVEAISRGTDTKADDKAAQVLELVEKAIREAGGKANPATVSRAAGILAALEADINKPSLAKGEEQKELISKLLKRPDVAAKFKKAGQ